MYLIEFWQLIYVYPKCITELQTDSDPGMIILPREIHTYLRYNPYISFLKFVRIFLEKHTGENPETYARMKQKDEYPEITHRNPTAGIYGKQYSYHLPIKQTAPV